MVLTKMQNDLKRPTSSKKRPETTYNEQEITLNDLKRARSSLKRPEKPTASMKRLFTYFLK